jgi:hypothetical protein
LQVRHIERNLLPMTEAEVLAAEQLAVTPAQRVANPALEPLEHVDRT